MDWIQVVQNVGLPIALILAIGAFVYKVLWPFFVRLYDEQRSERIKTQEAFLTALERRDVELTRIVDTVEDVTEAVKNFPKEVTNKDEKWQAFLMEQFAREDASIKALVMEIKELAKIVVATNTLITLHDSWERLRASEKKDSNNS